jgi:deoxyribonuclease IV
MMKFGLKVHHTDLDSLLYLEPEALEFVVNATDIDGAWVNDVQFIGPRVVHMPEKYLDGSLVDMGSLDEGERNRAIEIAKKAIDLAERLKASILVCHPGGVYQEHKEMSHTGLVDSMKQLKAYAGERVDVLMENMPDIYWYNKELWATCLFKDWKEIRDVLHETGMGMCMDLCHARLYCNSRHIDFNLYVTVLKPYIRHLHISDALGVSSEGLQIGDGEMDFKSLLKILEGLDAILVPEIVDGHKNNGAGFKMAKKRLSRLGYIKKDE